MFLLSFFLGQFRVVSLSLYPYPSSSRNISLRNLSFSTIYDTAHSPLSSVDLTYPVFRRRRGGKKQVRSKVSNKEGRAIAKKDRTLTFRYKQIEAYLTRKKSASSRESSDGQGKDHPVVRSILHSFLSPFPRDIYPGEHENCDSDSFQDSYAVK